MTSRHHPALPGGRPPPTPALPPPTRDPDGGGRHRDAAAEQLRSRLRAEVTAKLGRCARAEVQAGRPLMGFEDRGAFGPAVLVAAAAAHTWAARAGGEVVVAPVEDRLIGAVLENASGLGALLADSTIDEVTITGGDRAFVRRADGRRERRGPVAGSDAELVALVRGLAARCGVEERRFDHDPGVVFGLPGGASVAAVPAASARPPVSIRRHRTGRVPLADLRAADAIDSGLDAFLAAVVAASTNVLVTGARSAGKTTLPRALAAVVPPCERLVTVEEAPELGVDAAAGAATTRLLVEAMPLVVRLARPPGAAGRRVVSSARAVTGTDSGQVLSTEVDRPGLDLRALPGPPLTAGLLSKRRAGRRRVRPGPARASPGVVAVTDRPVQPSPAGGGDSADVVGRTPWTPR